MVIGLLTFVRQTIKELIDLLTPPRYFSWQTVIYLSLFSWLTSLLARLVAATAFTVGLLATISWICLAIGVGWALEANRARFFGIPIAPWVSGAILCLFLFGSWGGRWLQLALVLWPLVSFAVIAVPQLVSWDLSLKKPPPVVRQQLVLLFCLSLLFSSWFQFYFRIQSWVRDYPSLVADSVENSAFVYRLPGQTIALPAGVNHLTIAEETLREQVDNKPWPSVERWLLNLEGQRQLMRQRVSNSIGNSTALEDSLWQLDFQPLSNGNGYTLKLWAIWLGPAASPSGYYLEKTCQLMPVNRGGLLPENASPGYSTTPWASLTCDLQTPRQAGHPRGIGARG
ncbi:DUF5357 family protein [Leptolyngbya sp. KIOST-1]|uniref:DUF5357 family protein n=1 Tax=Leptolyngbya sp. KIOST-1 TaxID=1229172 RepID=UPI00056034E0|nr:DUF5357 family protein [Leptolyngbya sp. KIOST-1]